MKPTRSISRRSFLRRVGGGLAASGSFLGLTGCVTTGSATVQLTDFSIRAQ